MLNGYKTYLLCAAALAYAIGGFFTGNIDPKTALDMIWTALVAASVRHGIANS